MELIRLCISYSCLLSILLTSSWTEAKSTGIINTSSTTTTTTNPRRLINKASDMFNTVNLNKTCLSRVCDEHVNLQQLHDIASRMDQSIDPCDNFHKYACSQWQHPHDGEHTMMAVGEQQLTQKYQQIFEEPRELHQQDIVYTKLQQYYTTCRNSERTEKASWRAYISKLREMGYLHTNNHTHWLDTLRDLNGFANSQCFIALHVGRFNASMFMLNVNPHNVMTRAELSPEIYDILKYFQYSNKSLSEIKEKFENLEMDLENILNSSCINELQDENNECDLTEWLEYQDLMPYNKSTRNWRELLITYALKGGDLISVNDVATLDKINKYLNAAEPETLLAYAITRFLNHLQTFTHNIVKKGSSPVTCLRHMRKIFPLTMNYVYENVFYNSTVRQNSDPVVTTVFAQLKQQFAIRLDANQMQITSEAVQYLKKKLFALELNIGNVPKNVSREFYYEFVRDLKVNDNFYENHLNAMQHFFGRQSLLASADRITTPWLTFNMHLPDFLDALDSTAYYFCNANTIILPFAYLQLPFYDYRFWPSLLLGDLANTLGHELIHAFDTKFLVYDHGGNYNEMESLQILDNPEFKSNLACLNRNPTEFFTERIADISGTKLALRAFIKDPVFFKQNGKLFFLQFAQFFCGSATEEEFAQHDNTHDMDSLRLNYTLAQMPEFAEVFNCPLGSPMNPVEKCHLW